MLDAELATEADEDNNAVKNIISRAPRLCRAYGANFRNNLPHWLFPRAVFSLTWETFCLLANTAGPSLIAFEDILIDRTMELHTPNLFYPFTALRSLFWDCSTKFNVDNGVVLKDCFPCLETLRISRCDPSFLELLTRIE